MSVLTKFDELCQGYNLILDNVDSDFLRIAEHQLASQKSKHDPLREELERIKNELNEISQSYKKLELQHEHVTILLKNEIQARMQIQKEKELLEKQLGMVRDLVSSSASLSQEAIKEKLNIAINESSCSTGSLMSSLDVTCEPSEGSANFSAIHSSHPLPMNKAARISAVLHRESSRVQLSEEHSNDSNSKQLVATMTVPMSGKGPITATATFVLENVPSVKQEDNSKQACDKTSRKDDVSCVTGLASSVSVEKPHEAVRSSLLPPPGPSRKRSPGGAMFYLRRMTSTEKITQRVHTFSQKTILKPEMCLPCGGRIKFGKPALKCVGCKVTCHADCRSRMPVACVPSMPGPLSKNFGGTISDYAPTKPPMVPEIVVACVKEIERRGFKEIGIYRVSGTEKQAIELRDMFLRNKGPPPLSKIGIHVITSTLKLFFRSLKEPLITFTLWDSFVRIADMTDQMEIQTVVQATLIPDLPQPNRDTLAFMILHLQKVSEATACKMLPASLAKVFGPTIVGYSCPDPDPKLALKQLRKQHATLEKLMQIPGDYWLRFVSQIPSDSSRPILLRTHGSTSASCGLVN